MNRQPSLFSGNECGNKNMEIILAKHDTQTLQMFGDDAQTPLPKIVPECWEKNQLTLGQKIRRSDKRTYHLFAALWAAYQASESYKEALAALGNLAYFKRRCGAGWADALLAFSSEYELRQVWLSNLDSSLSEAERSELDNYYCDIFEFGKRKNWGAV